MKYVHLNGQTVSSDKAKIACDDRGLLLGDGVFTTLKYAAHQLCHFPQHFARLEASLSALMLSCNYTEIELAQICTQVIQTSGLADVVAAVRITFTRGHGGRGLDLPERGAPTVLVTADRYQPKQESVRLTKSSIRRHSSSFTARYKTLNYMDAIMARAEAKREGFDDALFCNEENFVACSTVANLFFIEQGVIKTPALKCGILPGIQRQVLLDLCQEKKISVIEGEWKFEELLLAEEIFLTNSLVGVLPVAQIENHTVNVGQGTFAAQLKQWI